MQAVLFEILAPQRYFLPFPDVVVALTRAGGVLALSNSSPAGRFYGVRKIQQHGRSE
ncbi:hypothetical protein PCAR4_470036 [Paraburkholderia caribensis]|jgi:hypothetical protein|nr:hypothetical protein PCAR4_470036 [Paraburkholderia caribensis]